MQRFPPQAPVRRDSQEQFFPEKFDIIQVPMPCRLNDDRKIRLSLDGEIFQFPRRPFFQADIDVRIAFVDDGNSPRQDGRTAIIGTADAHGAANGLPCVICSTGLSAEDETVLEDASAKTPIFRSANMSVGVNVLIELARQATKLLGGEFDIEIIEKHHHNKLDAPSGTALMIADAINAEAGNSYEYVYDRSQVRQKRGAKELGISSVRGGGIVGEHDVLFCGPDEVVTLSHSAGSRGVFADGAVQAALYIAALAPGYYTMTDLLRGKLLCE